MILHCPKCSLQHVDEGEWAKREHMTHKCVDCSFGKGCGHEWRPDLGKEYPIPTHGVERFGPKVSQFACPYCGWEHSGIPCSQLAAHGPGPHQQRPNWMSPANDTILSSSKETIECFLCEGIGKIELDDILFDPLSDDGWNDATQQNLAQYTDVFIPEFGYENGCGPDIKTIQTEMQKQLPKLNEIWTCPKGCGHPRPAHGSIRTFTKNELRCPLVPATPSIPIYVDDELDPNLPGGFTYLDDKPLLVKDLSTNKFKFINELTEMQQKALVIARINKRPDFYISFAHGFCKFNQQEALEEIKENSPEGQFIIEKELKILSRIYESYEK